MSHGKECKIVMTFKDKLEIDEKISCTGSGRSATPPGLWGRHKLAPTVRPTEKIREALLQDVITHTSTHYTLTALNHVFKNLNNV